MAGPPTTALRTPLLLVCGCVPGEQEISIVCCTAGAQQQMRAVSRCQLTQETDLAEHRLVSDMIIRSCTYTVMIMQHNEA